MRNVKELTVVLTLTALVFSLTGCQSAAKKTETAASSDVRTVTVALAPGFYPITYEDDNGKAAGYDVEVFKALDELLPQYEFKFEIVDKETMNVGVQAGTYQVGINSMFKTPEREEIYLLPENNMGYTAVAGLSRASEDKITSFDDVHDRALKIVPLDASGTIANVVKEWNAANPDATIEAEIKSGTDNAEALNSVRAGEYDFYIHLLPVINLWPDELKQDLVVSDPLTVVPTYPVINKNEPELNAAINEQIKVLKDNGTLSKLSNDAFGFDVFEYAK